MLICAYAVQVNLTIDTAQQPAAPTEANKSAVVVTAAGSLRGDDMRYPSSAAQRPTRSSRFSWPASSDHPTLVCSVGLAGLRIHDEGGRCRVDLALPCTFACAHPLHLSFGSSARVIPGSPHSAAGSGSSTPTAADEGRISLRELNVEVGCRIRVHAGLAIC
jgi:hypothetical protein